MSIRFYRAFGLPFASEIELPALSQIEEGEWSSTKGSTKGSTASSTKGSTASSTKTALESSTDLSASPNGNWNPVVKSLTGPVKVSLGQVDEDALFADSTFEKRPFSSYNEKTFYYNIPDVAKYSVKNGSEIKIHPLCEDWNQILLFFYSNCLAATLYQNDIVPLHASGVLDADNRLWLISAPSRVGKSTTALMLSGLGYRLFSDDTVALSVSDSGCRAWASYPMARVWPRSIKEQKRFSEDDFFVIRDEVEKTGVFFHSDFISESVEIAGLILLKMEGDEIKIDPLNGSKSLEMLSFNLYRNQWVKGMRKQLLQFKVLTSFVKSIPAWSVTRPKSEATFEDLAVHIESSIIKPNSLQAARSKMS